MLKQSFAVALTMTFFLLATPIVAQAVAADLVGDYVIIKGVN